MCRISTCISGSSPPDALIDTSEQESLKETLQDVKYGIARAALAGNFDLQMMGRQFHFIEMDDMQPQASFVCDPGSVLLENRCGQ